MIINDLLQEQLTSSNDTSGIICSQNIDNFSSVSLTILSTVFELFTANKLALIVDKMNRTKL